MNFEITESFANIMKIWANMIMDLVHMTCRSQVWCRHYLLIPIESEVIDKPNKIYGSDEIIK